MIIARPIEMRELGANGIPKDLLEVMDYFNRGIASQQGMYRFIPRKTPVTLEEIRTLWLPSLSRNINAVAEDLTKSRVIGAATVFYDPTSTAYQPSTQRPSGELALTVDPDYSYTYTADPLIRQILNRLRELGKRATMHTDVKFRQETKVMRDLGYQARFLKDYPRYIEAGLSGRVLEYHLP